MLKFIKSMNTLYSFVQYVLFLIQKYPCGIEWGSRKKWDAFSRTWSLPRQSLQAIYSTCDNIQDPSCPAIPSPTTTAPTSATPRITSESYLPVCTSNINASVESSSPSMTNHISSTPYTTPTEPSIKENITDAFESSGYLL